MLNGRYHHLRSSITARSPFRRRESSLSPYSALPSGLSSVRFTVDSQSGYFSAPPVLMLLIMLRRRFRCSIASCVSRLGQAAAMISHHAITTSLRLGRLLSQLSRPEQTASESPGFDLIDRFATPAFGRLPASRSFSTDAFASIIVEMGDLSFDHFR